MCSTLKGATQPKMLSVGLHCRLIGKPARIAGLIKFLDYIQTLQRRMDLHAKTNCRALAQPFPHSKE